MPDFDPYDLRRFVAAQERTFALALAEIEAGKKRSHWMWFVFPQLKGLGSSPAAQRYGLAGLGEAQAHLAHPLLGPRLVQATRAALGIEGRTLTEVFGRPDDLKFRSSMTLFERAGDDEAFGQALDRLCRGERDGRTLALLDP